MRTRNTCTIHIHNAAIDAFMLLFHDLSSTYESSRETKKCMKHLSRMIIEATCAKAYPIPLIFAMSAVSLRKFLESNTFPAATAFKTLGLIQDGHCK